TSGQSPPAHAFGPPVTAHPGTGAPHRPLAGPAVADYDQPTMSRRPPRTGPPPSARPDPPIAPTPNPLREPESGQGVIAKVLAFVGAGVLLIGIGFLLVLAAQAGFFGPVAQVVSVGALAAGLLALALWLRHRSPVGSITLAAVAFAAGYLDVAAITALHQWLSRPVGLAIGGVIALGGLVLARFWRSGALATIVSLGVLVLVPMVSPTTTSALSFALAFAAVSLAATWGLGWWGAQLARLLPLGLVALYASLSVPTDDPDFTLLLGASVILVLLGFLEGVAARFAADPDADPASPAGRRAAMLTVTSAACLILLVLPSLAVGVRLGADPGAVLLVAVGVGLLAVAASGMAPSATRAVAAGTGSLWAPVGAALWLSGSWLPIPFLVTSLVVIAIARLTSSSLYGWLAVVHATVTITFTALHIAPLFDRPSALGGFPVHPVRAVLALLALVLLRDLVQRLPERLADRVQRHRPAVHVVTWVVALVLLSPAVVAVSTWLGDLVGDAEAGFRIGHGGLTIGWFVVAAVALMVGLRHSAGASAQRGFGLALFAVAVTKLLLWDLSVLSGLVRVAVAIVAGLLLIGLGMWYARALERLRPEPAPEPPVRPTPPPSAWPR
ncbi:MAG: DUF2339 domain-containing protein, partial [Propionibacterium sp.]|nr:DUF2339 domain-containing protein [Propionibacterium sp.]